MFFGYFSRFIIAWKNAETQNEQRKKKMEAEARKQAAKDNVSEKPAPTEKVVVWSNTWIYIQCTDPEPVPWLTHGIKRQTAPGLLDIM